MKQWNGLRHTRNYLKQATGWVYFKYTDSFIVCGDYYSLPDRITCPRQSIVSIKIALLTTRREDLKLSLCARSTLL